MTALLKAMGVTVWTLAAVGLLIIGGIIGFRALHIEPALRATAPLASPVAPPPAVPDPVIRSAAPVAAVPRPSLATPSVPIATVHDAPDPLAMRMRFSEAAGHHDALHIIEYGRQLEREGAARATDAEQIALAFFAIGDCTNTRAWIGKATPPRDRALVRAQSVCERTALPVANPTTSGPAAASGDRDVRLGELFYGFNDFSQAVGYLRRGLSEGGLTHPDDAYVYLGLSYLALDQYADACAAFDDLEQVQSVSPRVRRLWALFADTHCRVARAR